MVKLSYEWRKKAKKDTIKLIIYLVVMVLSIFAVYHILISTPLLQPYWTYFPYINAAIVLAFGYKITGAHWQYYISQCEGSTTFSVRACVLIHKGKESKMLQLEKPDVLIWM